MKLRPDWLGRYLTEPQRRRRSQQERRSTRELTASLATPAPVRSGKTHATVCARVLARARNPVTREKRLTLTHTQRGVRRRTVEPQTLLGRLQRVVLPVKRDRSPDNPKIPATTLPACLIASGLALAQCTKVYPGAAGLARLHYGGCSKVRVRLQQPNLSAPKCTEGRRVTGHRGSERVLNVSKSTVGT